MRCKCQLISYIYVPIIKMHKFYMSKASFCLEIHEPKSQHTTMKTSMFFSKFQWRNSTNLAPDHFSVWVIYGTLGLCRKNHQNKRSHGQMGFKSSGVICDPVGFPGFKRQLNYILQLLQPPNTLFYINFPNVIRQLGPLIRHAKRAYSVLQLSIFSIFTINFCLMGAEIAAWYVVPLVYGQWVFDILMSSSLSTFFEIVSSNLKKQSFVLSACHISFYIEY